MNTLKILNKYTLGEATLEETNTALKAENVPFHLDPHKNDLTPDEILATTVSDNPESVTGWGLLDTGTGSLEKVHVVGGVLRDVDCGEMYAMVLIGGKTYNVKGAALDSLHE